MNETYEQLNGWHRTLEDIQKILPSLDTHTLDTKILSIEGFPKENKLHGRSSEKELSKSKKLKSDNLLRENKIAEPLETTKAITTSNEPSQNLLKAAPTE
ncbi:MAG: hypothetical protein K0M45_10495 [Candidatus Paracaedibacteraceae bacterium]|nr:hypothetical protein [Candidatus Paracaedibacteraceae bacterium]